MINSCTYPFRPKVAHGQGLTDTRQSLEAANSLENAGAQQSPACMEWRKGVWHQVFLGLQARPVFLLSFPQLCGLRALPFHKRGPLRRKGQLGGLCGCPELRCVLPERPSNVGFTQPSQRSSEQGTSYTQGSRRQSSQ